MRALLLLLVLSSWSQAAECDAVDCTWTVGMRLFREERYDEALPWLEQGLRLSHDPKFLFEIGEAHRLAGRDPQAIVAYESFVKIAPYAANLKQVEALLAECRLRVEERRAFFQPPPATPRRRANALMGSGGGVMLAGLLVSLAGVPWLDRDPNVQVPLLSNGVLALVIGGTLLTVGIAEDRR